MENITIIIDSESKEYLESLGHDPVDVAQRLLDSHLDRIIKNDFNSTLTRKQKLDKLNKVII